MNYLAQKISVLKKQKNAVILAHTYQSGAVQDIADFVGDSYGLSVEAARVKSDTIIFCGVSFMAETAAILNPHSTVILPAADAGCPMADMITAADLRELMHEHPNYLVVCYVNTTAEIKALSHVCVTSSNAVKIVSKLPLDQGIIFVPDKYLGSFVMEQTGRPMVLWNGFCPTHARIKPDMLIAARREHPQATILIHPEAPDETRALADAVLSTGGMCDFVKQSSAVEFIIATELGIIHTLQTQSPGKKFYPVDQSVICPNMKKTTVHSVINALEGTGGKKIVVPEDIAKSALVSLQRMLDMAR